MLLVRHSHDGNGENQMRSPPPLSPCCYSIGIFIKILLTIYHLCDSENTFVLEKYWYSTYQCILLTEHFIISGSETYELLLPYLCK